MKIKFIKNKDEEYCNMKVLNDNEILLTSNKESKYDNILAEKYYKFNLKFKSYEEILPEIEKLDVIVIEDISGIKNLIYFCTCTDLGNGKQIISFLSYDVEAKITKEIFEIEDTISLYPFEKTITTYVLDENYLLVQEGYLKRNLAGNFSAILDFKLYLYDIGNNSKHQIMDERLAKNGIKEMFSVVDKKLIIKTGTTLLQDNRWRYFNKTEAPDEYILMLDKATFIQSIVSSSRIELLNILDHECWDKTINYITLIDNFIVYAKTCYPSRQNEYGYYDYINKKQYHYKDDNIKDEEYFSTQITVINKTPYAIVITRSGAKFKNLCNSNEIFSSEYNSEIKSSFDNIIVSQAVEERGKKGTLCPVVNIYQFPEMRLLGQRKGIYFKSFITSSNLVCIIV